jgi:4-hydroxy-3-methylbut-2-en-1-yl diphosphate synthase IspG/GcpE
VPLVADIHFQPAVAMMVAEAFEKVRVLQSVLAVCSSSSSQQWP